MKKELAVQNGGIRIFKEKDEICGYFLHTRENGREEIQEAVMKDENAFRAAFRIKGETPIIMARIVDVPSMLSLLRTEKGNVMLTVQIEDDMIQNNNAVWEWQVSAEGAQADRIGDSADCRITIEALTAWIFGYRKAEECFVFQENGSEAGKMKKQEVLGNLAKIRCFQNIFINEIV